MNDFEARLKSELARVDPGVRFTDAVLARVATNRSGWRVLTGGRMQRAVLWAAAACVVVGSVGGFRFERQRMAERQAGVLAQQRFALAMQLTSRTLAHVDGQISRVGRRE